MAAAAMGPLLIGLAVLIKSVAIVIGAVTTLTALLFSWLGVAILVAGIAYTIRAAWIQNVDNIRGVFQDWLNMFKEGFEWLA